MTSECKLMRRGASVRRALVRSAREFMSDECPDAAAALTYYGVLSLFPALLILVSLLGVVGQDERVATVVLQILGEVAPPSVLRTIRGPVEQLVASPKAGIALAGGLVVAVWSASRYIGAFGRAMNRIREVDESRPIWKRLPQQLALTLVVLALAAAVALMLVLTGPLASAVGQAFGMGQMVLTIWNIGRWPVLLACIGAIIAVLYQATPNIRQPRFRWLGIGATVATTGWVAMSMGFAFYATNFGAFQQTYGGLAGVIVFLLWLWLTNLALLFGAELHTELQRAHRKTGEGLAQT
jgi:membrane protein